MDEQEPDYDSTTGHRGREGDRQMGGVVKSSFSLNPYSRVFFNEAIEEVVQH